MKTALLGGAPSLQNVSCLAGVGTHSEEFKMPKNGDTPTPSRQQVSCCDSVDNFDFTRDLVAFFGADHLLAVARYRMDGREHVEIAGPMPRGWRQMIPSRARHRDLPRILWRNSRGKKTHPVDFTHVGELAAELAEQRAARRAAR